MSKKLFLFLGVMLPFLLGANDSIRPIQPSELQMDKNTTFRDGIFTVSIPETPGIPNETKGARFQLNVAEFAGKAVRFRAEMKSLGINSDTTGPHVGGKILIVYRNASDIASYTPSTSLLGTSDSWQEFSCFCSFPVTMKSAVVVFGIQQAWGKLEFRNLTYEIIPEKKNVTMPAGFQCEYSKDIAVRSPMRGVMSPPPGRITAQDIRDLGKWKANLIRYQIVDGIKDLKNLKEYERWMDKCLDKLEELTPVLKENGIKVIIDMHGAPGGRYRNIGLLGTAGEAAANAYGNNGRFLMMEEPIYRDAFIETWKRIAMRFKTNPVVYGYDLINEPDQRGPAKFDYQELQFDAAKAIRAIDAETPIVVSGNRWSNPIHFDMTPLPLKNIIYQIHMYEPGDYTHQGVGDQLYSDVFPQKCWDYRTRDWNREKLRSTLKMVTDFQKKYGAKILVGEFSVTIWAPGAASYLEDVISLFEENKWDWTYHAFREWEGWSVEHAGTPKEIKRVENTDRKKVLLDYFKRNQ